MSLCGVVELVGELSGRRADSERPCSDRAERPLLPPNLRWEGHLQGLYKSLEYHGCLCRAARKSRVDLERWGYRDAAGSRASAFESNGRNGGSIDDRRGCAPRSSSRSPAGLPFILSSTWSQDSLCSLRSPSRTVAERRRHSTSQCLRHPRDLPTKLTSHTAHRSVWASPVRSLTRLHHLNSAKMAQRNAASGPLSPRIPAMTQSPPARSSGGVSSIATRPASHLNAVHAEVAHINSQYPAQQTLDDALCRVFLFHASSGQQATVYILNDSKPSTSSTAYSMSYLVCDPHTNKVIVAIDNSATALRLLPLQVLHEIASTPPPLGRSWTAVIAEIGEGPNFTRQHVLALCVIRRAAIRSLSARQAGECYYHRKHQRRLPCRPKLRCSRIRAAEKLPTCARSPLPQERPHLRTNQRLMHHPVAMALRGYVAKETSRKSPHREAAQTLSGNGGLRHQNERVLQGPACSNQANDVVPGPVDSRRPGCPYVRDDSCQRPTTAWRASGTSERHKRCFRFPSLRFMARRAASSCPAVTLSPCASHLCL